MLSVRSRPNESTALLGGPKSHNSGRVWVLLTLIVACGLFLRTYDLALNSLWLDELYSLKMATVTDLSAWRGDAHPPLYYLLLKGWVSFSAGDWWVRFLSVVFGTATIPVVYLISAKIFSRRAGLAASSLMAILSLHVAYSQEARMYTVLVFFFALGLLGVAQAALKNRKSGWVLMFCGSIGAAYSHGIGPLYSALILCFYPVMAWVHGRRPNWIFWLTTCVIVAVLYVPWALNLMQLTQSGQMVFWEKQPSWTRLLTHIQELGLADIPALSSVLNNYLSLQLPETPKFLWQIPIVIGVALIVLLRHDRKLLLSLMALYLVPILVVFLVSLARTPIYGARIILPACLPLVIVLGAAVDLKRPFVRIGYIIFWFTATLLLIGSFYYLRYHPAKEQWREALAYISESAQAEDAIIFNVDGPSMFILDRYGSSLKSKSVEIRAYTQHTEACGGTVKNCLDGMVSTLASTGEYWFVNSHEEFVAGAASIKDWKLERMKCESPKIFIGLTLDKCRAAGPASD